MSVDLEIVKILVKCEYPLTSHRYFTEITPPQLRCLSLLDLEPFLRCRLPPGPARFSLVAKFISSLINHEEGQHVPNKGQPELTPFSPVTIKQEVKLEGCSENKTENSPTFRDVSINCVLDADITAKERAHIDVAIQDMDTAVDHYSFPLFSRWRALSLQRKFPNMSGMPSPYPPQQTWCRPRLNHELGSSIGSVALNPRKPPRKCRKSLEAREKSKAKWEAELLLMGIQPNYYRPLEIPEVQKDSHPQE